MTTSAEAVVVTIAVVGSRTFRDYRLMCDTLDALCAAYDDNVAPRLVSGGRRAPTSWPSATPPSTICTAMC